MSVVAIVGARERSAFKEQLNYETLTGSDARKIMENMLVIINEETALGALMRKHMLSDYQLVDTVLTQLVDKYRGNLSVISTGCDDGIGAIVKSQCIGKSIRFAELACHFWDTQFRRNRTEYMQFYQARNSFFDELGDEFHLLVNDTRNSMVENLLDRINIVTPMRPRKRPRTIYAQNGSILKEE